MRISGIYTQYSVEKGSRYDVESISKIDCFPSIPLEQGLKQSRIPTFCELLLGFPSIPLEQGLKRVTANRYACLKGMFPKYSIRTRIKTKNTSVAIVIQLFVSQVFH